MYIEHTMGDNDVNAVCKTTSKTGSKFNTVTLGFSLIRMPIYILASFTLAPESRYWVTTPQRKGYFTGR